MGSEVDLTTNKKQGYESGSNGSQEDLKQIMIKTIAHLALLIGQSYQ